MSNDSATKYRVEILQISTGERSFLSAPLSKRQAERVKRGMEINMGSDYRAVIHKEKT